MSIGMSYEDYWDGDCTMTKYYRDAYKYRVKEQNRLNWSLGRYIYEALVDVSPAFGFNRGRIQPYLDEPFPMKFEKEKEKADEKKKLEKSSAYMMQMALQFNKRRKEKQNGD